MDRFSVILSWSRDEIFAWLDEETEDDIKKYLAFYESKEYYEVCCVFRDYLNLYHEKGRTTMIRPLN